MDPAQHSLLLQLHEVPPDAGLGGMEQLTKFIEIDELLVGKKLLNFQNSLGLAHGSISRHYICLKAASFGVL